MHGCVAIVERESNPPPTGSGFHAAARALKRHRRIGDEDAATMARVHGKSSENARNGPYRSTVNRRCPALVFTRKRAGVMRTCARERQSGAKRLAGKSPARAPPFLNSRSGHGQGAERLSGKNSRVDRSRSRQVALVAGCVAAKAKTCTRECTCKAPRVRRALHVRVHVHMTSRSATGDRA